MVALERENRQVSTTTTASAGPTEAPEEPTEAPEDPTEAPEESPTTPVATTTMSTTSDSGATSIEELLDQFFTNATGFLDNLSQTTDAISDALEQVRHYYSLFTDDTHRQFIPPCF